MNNFFRNRQMKSTQDTGRNSRSRKTAKKDYHEVSSTAEHRAPLDAIITTGNKAIAISITHES